MAFSKKSDFKIRDIKRHSFLMYFIFSCSAFMKSRFTRFFWNWVIGYKKVYEFFSSEVVFLN